MQISVYKIVSGGQTGADRAAWDFAIKRNLQIGGFVPKGRAAEDGQIAEKYRNLHETESSDPAQRTELNVLYSDATLILSHNVLIDGSKLTLEIARKLHKPVLHINFKQIEFGSAVEKTQNWLTINKSQILNVAGPRASEDQMIYEKTLLFLAQVFN